MAITAIGATVALQQNHVFPGTILVDNGATLSFNGHTLDVRALINNNGTLTMSSVADTLIARQDASLLGRENFTAGTLITQGGLSVILAAGIPGLGLNASGTEVIGCADPVTGAWRRSITLPVDATGGLASSAGRVMVALDKGAAVFNQATLCAG